MRALITGSSGHIGGTIAEYLAGLGWETVGLDCRPPATPCIINHHIQADIGSTREWDGIPGRIQPCDVIIHAAAVIRHDLFGQDVPLVNCLGTQQVLRLAAEWKVRGLIYLSSVPVIGRPRERPVTEEHPVDPPSAYHASKLFGEHLVRLAGMDAGIPAASFRLTSPIGPGMPPNRIFSVFAGQALAGKPILIAGTGARRQNYVDARDIARAAELWIKQPKPGLFNVAGGESISNRELAETIVRTLTSSSTVALSGKPDPDDGLAWDVSIEKARSSFGFEPAYGIEQSVRDYAAGLRET